MPAFCLRRLLFFTIGFVWGTTLGATVILIARLNVYTMIKITLTVSWGFYLTNIINM